MNPRIAELQEIIRKSEEELQTIRSRCSHTEFFVGMWSGRVGSWNPSRICSDCHIAISGITKEESEKVWNEFNGKTVT